MNSRQMHPIETALFIEAKADNINALKTGIEALEKIKNNPELLFNQSDLVSIPSLFSVNDDKENLLFYAIKMNASDEIIDYLFQFFKSRHDIILGKGGSELVWIAIKKNKANFLEKLFLYAESLKDLPQSQKPWRMRDIVERNLLSLAIYEEKPHLFFLILSRVLKEVDALELVNQADRSGKTPLHYACVFNAPLNIFKSLIKAGADLTVICNNLNMPFYRYKSPCNDYILDLALSGVLIGKNLPATFIHSLKHIDPNKHLFLMGCTVEDSPMTDFQIPVRWVTIQGQENSFKALNINAQKEILENSNGQLKFENNSLTFLPMPKLETVPRYLQLNHDRKILGSIRKEILHIKNQMAKKSDTRFIGKIYNIFSNASLWLGYGGLEIKFIFDALKVINDQTMGTVLGFGVGGFCAMTLLTWLNCTYSSKLFLNYNSPSQWIEITTYLREEILNALNEANDSEYKQQKDQLELHLDHLEKPRLPSVAKDIFQQLYDMLSHLMLDLNLHDQPIFYLFSQTNKHPTMYAMQEEKLNQSETEKTPLLAFNV